MSSVRANAAYAAYRARGVMNDGRRFGRPPGPYRPPELPAGKINVTDPDARNVKPARGWVQGDNVQAAVTEQQVVIAAEVTVDSPDFGELKPILSATETEPARTGVSQPPEPVPADARYHHQVQIEAIVNPRDDRADRARRRQTQARAPGPASWRPAFMRRVLDK